MRLSNRKCIMQVRESDERQPLTPSRPCFTFCGFLIVPLLVVASLSLSACAQLNSKTTPNNQTPTNGSGNEGNGTRTPDSPVVPVDLPVTEPHDDQALSLDLALCRTNISNPPLSEGKKVTRKSGIGCLNNVPVRIATAPGACLTSGFGPRGSKLHKGLDYQSKPAGPVVAAADGKILINKFRPKDLGNWIVIDHGLGVYTGYGHLATVDTAIRKGAVVSAGQVLGIMGKTGDATNSVHLHFEVRRGKAGMFRNFFLLKEVDPFALPESCPPAGQLATG